MPESTEGVAEGATTAMGQETNICFIVRNADRKN
nr:MAG TPA: hypothetical protein [Caudoviricetes sp.]